MTSDRLEEIKARLDAWAEPEGMSSWRRERHELRGDLAWAVKVIEAAEEMAPLLKQAFDALNSPELNSVCLIAGLHGAGYRGPVADLPRISAALSAYAAAKEGKDE